MGSQAVSGRQTAFKFTSGAADASWDQRQHALLPSPASTIISPASASAVDYSACQWLLASEDPPRGCRQRPKSGSGWQPPRPRRPNSAVASLTAFHQDRLASLAVVQWLRAAQQRLRQLDQSGGSELEPGQLHPNRWRSLRGGGVVSPAQRDNADTAKQAVGAAGSRESDTNGHERPAWRDSASRYRCARPARYAAGIADKISNSTTCPDPNYELKGMARQSSRSALFRSFNQVFEVPNPA